MRTNFTSEDLKILVDTVFNGNLWLYKASNGNIEYENPNSEKILLINENTGSKEEKDLAEYLNVKFYNWKHRVEERQDYGREQPLSVLESWVESLNFSLNETYALVEKVDTEDVESQDIDGATITGKITFLVQADKLVNLDYYVTKIRNFYLGSPQEIQNSFGKILKAYFNIGALNYEQEPFITQLGESVIVSLNFQVNYINDALTYSDNKVEISLDGDDLYDNEGNIVDLEGNPTTTKYLPLPITNATFQNIFTTDAVPTNKRPDLTGYVASSISSVKTLTFYDFNKELTMRFDDIFWEKSAYRINGKLTEVKDVNIPVYIKIIRGDKTYIYKDVIEKMEKVVTNNDFNISSISTRGWGKVGV